MMVMMIMNFSSLRNMLSVRRLLDVNMRGIHFSFKVALNDEQRNRCFWSCDLSIVDDFRGEGQFQCFDNSDDEGAVDVDLKYGDDDNYAKKIHTKVWWDSAF